MSDLILPLGGGLAWLGRGALLLWALPLLALALPAPAARALPLARAADGASRLLLRVSIGAALLMAGMQLAVIVARYVFGEAASWANETVVYGYAALFMLGAAPALLLDGHVRVDVIATRLSPRARAGIELAGLYLFLLPICLLILWSAISPSFVRAWAEFEGSRESDGLPLRFLFRTLVPAFAVALLVQGWSQALKAALAVRGHPHPGAPLPLSAEGQPHGA